MQRAQAAKRSKNPSSRATSFDPSAAKAFGRAVRELREGQQIAQDAFALVAGVDRSYFGKLERGERQPTFGLMLRIAGALGLPAAVLVELAEEELARSRS